MFVEIDSALVLTGTPDRAGRFSLRCRAAAKGALQRQVVRVLVLHILTHPQYDRAQAYQAVGDYILHTHEHHWEFDARNDVAQDEDGDAAGHAASEGGKSEEEDDPRLQATPEPE